MMAPTRKCPLSWKYIQQLCLKSWNFWHQLMVTCSGVLYRSKVAGTTGISYKFGTLTAGTSVETTDINCFIAGTSDISYVKYHDLRVTESTTEQGSFEWEAHLSQLLLLTTHTCQYLFKTITHDINFYQLNYKLQYTSL